VFLLPSYTGHVAESQPTIPRAPPPPPPSPCKGQFLLGFLAPGYLQ